MILETILMLVAAFASYQAYKIYSIWEGYRRHKKQGVIFNDAKGFSAIRDLLELGKLL
jgi:hypothetical protein